MDLDLNDPAPEEADGVDLDAAVPGEAHGFDLNLPLDEFGAVDFDFLENNLEHAEVPVEVNHRRKEMSEDLRKQVYQALLARSKNGKLGKKDTKSVADQFSLHIRSVQHLWNRDKIQLANSVPVVVSSLKKGRVGRRAIHIDLEAVRNIPLKERMTIEDLSRPRFRDGDCIFDGRLGCFPLVTYEPAIRGNQRTGRVRDDLVMKPITSITRDVIRDFMINMVLPAIRAKWPREDMDKLIFVQQDNAPSHLKLDDPLFCEAAKQERFDIRLIYQPPNSPDFNILDLDFFRAIQPIQYKKNAKTIEALVPAVQEAFIEYCPYKANRMFVTLQSVLKEAIRLKETTTLRFHT